MLIELIRVFNLMIEWSDSNNLLLFIKIWELKY